MGREEVRATPMHVDNSGAVELSKERPSGQRSQYVDRRDLKAPKGPLELNPACSDPTPLKVDEEEGLFSTGADSLNAFLSIEPPRQRLCAQSLSGCIKARIKLRLNSARSRDLLSVRAVVDSGAAHIAITRSVFKRLGGTHLQPTRLTLTGVGGESLNCLGCSPIQFALGEIWLQTSAYVFEELVEPILLGANTMVDHGLNVDAANMALRRSKSQSACTPPRRHTSRIQTPRPRLCGFRACTGDK
eukprot:6212065-Pleurochrysis_carterae.AAC.6